MKRYTDLTGALENGLWSYRSLPGLESIIPEVSIETIATVKENEFFASRVTLSTISGAYVEAGAHILERGRTLDQYTVQDFIRPARILRLPQQPAKALIDAPLLEEHAPPGGIRRGEALLIQTGWGAQWNREGYVLGCPNFTRRAVEWAVGQGISIFGVDVPCIESSWSEDVVEEKGGLLGLIFRKDILLVAPLVNLEGVRGDRGTVICLPLPLRGTSGAPARIVFEEEV